MTQPPAKIAGFEILQQLGEGGSGQVYKARQVSLGRDVAIKVLHPSLVDSEEDIERFRHEAQVAARLKHPGIVQVYEFGADQGMHFIAMEYISGYSVSDWLERRGTLDEANVLGVALGVAKALEYAWDRQKLVHYDIKPDNVLIDEDGSVKVVDLGLALLMGAESGTPGDTTFHCTPNYASPEHIEGKERCDFRTDIYSLGAMMVHLLTGKLPFAQHSETEVLRLQMGAEVEDPHQSNAEISVGMSLLLRRMMAKRPEDRYASWAEAIVDLERVAKGEWPAHPLPEESPSTIAFHRYDRKGPHRREVRVVHTSPGAAAHKPAHTAAVPRKRQSSPFAAIFVGLVIIGGGVVAATSMNQNASLKQRAGLVEKDLAAASLLAEAVAFARAQPASAEATTRLESAARAASGTGYELLAQTQLSLLRAQQKRLAAQTLVNISKQTAPLIAAGRYGSAARVWRSYEGPHAEATRNVRLVESARLERLDVKNR
jgi:serine/threonine protein kinase